MAVRRGLGLLSEGGRSRPRSRFAELEVAAAKTPGGRQIVRRVDIERHAHVGRLDFDQFVAR